MTTSEDVWVYLSPDKVTFTLRLWSAVAVPAGVVGVAFFSAVVALFEMATEGRSATNLDGSHDAQLLQRKPVGFPISSAVRSKNIGHFESGPRHPELFPGLLSGLDPERVERAGCGRDHVVRNHRVTCGSVDSGVAQQHLDDTCVGTIFQKMRGERMTERVGGNAFGQAALLRGIPAGL